MSAGDPVGVDGQVSAIPCGPTCDPVVMGAARPAGTSLEASREVRRRVGKVWRESLLELRLAPTGYTTP